MQKKIVFWIVPIFIITYFTLAYYPILTRQKMEIFPFFSFKLYSKVPKDYERYDILFNYGESSEHFLVFGNKDLNKLERKNFNYTLGKMAENFSRDSVLNISSFNYLLEEGNSAYFVRISGNCIEVLEKEKFKVELLAPIKE